MDELALSLLKPVRVGFLIKIFMVIKDILKINKRKTGSEVAFPAVTKHRIKFNLKTAMLLFYEFINRVYIMLNDIPHYSVRKRLINNFKAFWDEYLVRTEPFTERDLLAGKCEIFDVYVSGSDQIWNPFYVGLSPIYYLGFTPSRAKRISFASSFGNYKFDDGQLNKGIMNYLRQYSYISVREEKSVHDLKRYIGTDAVDMLDPTLMLNKDDWIQAMSLEGSRPPEKGYLLVYALSDRRRLYRLGRKLGKKLALRVCILDLPGIFNFGCDFLPDISPRSFIERMLHASFIVTNSFHGTAFACNFNIPFYSVMSNTPERQKAFLKLVDLQDRLLPKNCRSADLKPLNFSKVNGVLAEKRKLDLESLDAAIWTGVEDLTQNRECL